jgi:hypothetical protein
MKRRDAPLAMTIEPVFVVMHMEQPQLLAAMDRVEHCR